MCALEQRDVVACLAWDIAIAFSVKIPKYNIIYVLRVVFSTRGRRTVA